MICERCRAKMSWKVDGSIQGWCCSVCGWSVITTYIDDINLDMTEYSLFIKNVLEIDRKKIQLIARIANVNFITAKQMLEKKETCILKAKAPEIKAVVAKLQEADVDFKISPFFKY